MKCARQESAKAMTGTLTLHVVYDNTVTIYLNFNKFVSQERHVSDDNVEIKTQHVVGVFVENPLSHLPLRRIHHFFSFLVP